jgi:hypothetical protein
MARKTKLTPQVQGRIVQAIRSGNYANVAARYAGIDERSYFGWMQRGEREGSGIYFQFFLAIKDAESAAEVEAVAQVRLAARESWQAAMTWLERKFPERWGRRERIDVSHADVDVKRLSDAELESLAALESKR